MGDSTVSATSCIQSIDARCDEAILQGLAANIFQAINNSAIDMETLRTVKLNLRKSIDCQPHPTTKNVMFLHYEDLCKRRHIIANVVTDLKTKLKLVNTEIQQCLKRSKGTFTYNIK